MSQIYNYNGSITINNANIVYNDLYNNITTPAINNNNGSITINNATIQSSGYGIENSGTGILIYGKTDNLTGPTITTSNNYGIYNDGATFKYYSGTIQGKDEAINGAINEIAANKVVSLSKVGNIETAELSSNLNIAQIGSVQYTNLNTAITDFDSSINQEITIINDFTLSEDNKVTISNSKDLTLNLNGHTITTYAVNSAITNNGTLSLKDNLGNGKISSRSNTIITNNGTLEIDGGTYISTVNTNYLVINKGSFTLTSGNITSANYAIQNDSLGNSWLNGGNITINGLNSNSYAVNNTSGKVYINSPVSIIANATTSVSALKNSQAGEIEMNGGTVRSKKYINNEGVFTLNGGTIEFTSYGYIDNSSYGSIRMTGGTITSESYGIRNNSVNAITIEAGTITTNDIAILNMTNSNRNELIEIKGGTITSQNNVAINNIKGRSGQQRLVITGGTVISQVGIAVQNSAILTLGKDEGDYPSTTVPEINGKTYGVKNTGTFNFYDGIVKGETAAIDGTVTDKPYGYKVVTNVANTEAYLEISPEVDKPVILNGNNMDSLEIAMQTLSNFETKVGTIVLRKNITLTETLVIPSDVTVTFVLQGHAITYNGSDATIENNGTFTIVDYQDPTESLSPGDASIVRNTGTGVAIENNGSLTLGASGGQVNADSPLISGGVTGNTPTIYDGKIEN